MKTMKVAALLLQSTGFIRWDLPPPRDFAGASHTTGI
jgi:hypothetical protein